MLSRKQKRLVLPLAQNPPHALILVRSLGMRRTGHAPLYQYSTVFRNNQKEVSSVKSVRFQLSLMCFWAHSILFCLCISVSIGVANGCFLSYPRSAKCRKTVT